jgi:peptidylprolyl isomerase domain and WD repeat-containing protein 1
LNLTITKDGRKMAILSKDRKIRLFDVLSGKIYKTIDESIDVYTGIQQVNTNLSHTHPNLNI